MRVVAGTLRGRRLETPAAGSFAIRPTADKAREALFSILNARSKGGFLDLFSGTGAVAVEAWSRGFLPVLSVESSPEALGILRKNMRNLDIQVVGTDARRLNDDAFEGLSVVFADPPYAESASLFEALAPRVRRWIGEKGVMVWETDRDTILTVQEGWELVDDRRYGAARFRFFEPR